MEFIRQLVAFSIAMETSDGILGKAPDRVEETWILVANASTETTLLDVLSPESQQRYHNWIDKWITRQPAAPQVEELTEEEELEQAPFLKETEGQIGAVSPEPEPKKRRSKRGKDS